MSSPHIRLVPSASDGHETLAPLGGTAVLHHDGAAVVHVSGCVEDLPRVASVAWGIEQTGAFDQLVLHVGSGAGADDALNELDVPSAIDFIDSSAGGLLDALQAKLAQIACAVVIVHSTGEAALAAALAATRLGIAVVWVGTVDDAPVAATTRAVARLADLVLVHRESDAEDLGGRVSPERIHVVGNPLIDVVRRFARHPAARPAPEQHAHGHVLAILTDGAVAEALDADLAELAKRGRLCIVEAAPGVPPLVRARAAGARAIRDAGFVERLALERSARAIITDSQRVLEEANALGVRCYAVDGSDDARTAIARLEAQTPTPCAIPLWDGQAGDRVAAIVVANFARVSFVA